jgi:murein DD-endopeptidase MepM/ murein hydrolase activator NlpD
VTIDSSEKKDGTNGKKEGWIKGISWFVTLLLAVSMVGYTVLRPSVDKIFPTTEPDATAIPETPQVDETGMVEIDNTLLPDFNASLVQDSITRLAVAHTSLDTSRRESATTYTVESGDSLFWIANQYSIDAETILWANYATLKDDPDTLSIGQVLTIPPTDGIYYKWEDGDTIDSVASRYYADPQDILTYIGNNLDLTNPVIEAGTYVMIPGGYRSTVQWIVPTIARGKSGVAVNVIGAGACDTVVDGYYGSGSFVWPAGNHYLSGNDFASWHLGIDIAAGTGAPVYAADTGVVVYSGWSTQGYGNMVMIDHGNGYQTLYAHLSSLLVSCGAGVFQGQTIALAGSTGNSTGPHLHFEVRLSGGFVNPWYVLP